MNRSVLLISSEPLHPGDTFSSCFELAQAAALRAQGWDAAILSVFLLDRWGVVKALLRTLAGQRERNAVARRFTLPQLVRHLVRRRPTVVRHNLAGVPVYEAWGYPCRVGPPLGPRGVTAWTRAGLAAFQAYLADREAPPALVHAHSRPLLAAHLAYAIKARWGIRYLVTEHSTYYARGLLGPYQRRCLALSHGQAEEVLAVSSCLAALVRRELPEVTRVGVVPNCLDGAFLDLRLEPRERAFTFVCVGTLGERKNQAGVVRAFARSGLDDCRLALVGDGPARGELARLVEELGLGSRVEFWGHLSPPEVRDVLLRSHVLVIGSDVETFAVVGIEAHACGLPVVATRCGGPEDFVTQSNGLLLDGLEELPEALRRARESYGSYDPAEIRAECLRRFSPRAVALRLEERYAAALQPQVEDHHQP